MDKSKHFCYLDAKIWETMKKCTSSVEEVASVNFLKNIILVLALLFGKILNSLTTKKQLTQVRRQYQRHVLRSLFYFKVLTRLPLVYGHVSLLVCYKPITGLGM